jgi:RNA polymerase sigma factor (sigma-70 family)
MNVPDCHAETDAELLGEFSARGHHAAFAALVKRHGAMVHAVSMRILSNHHDAQDVSQAVFLALARDAGKLAQKPSVAGWLHTVSRRLSLNLLKSRNTRQLREQAVIEESTNARTSPSAGFRRELDAALQRLPERYRQPLVLFHLEGATLEETSRRLDLHPSTLRTRLSRARDMLRKILVRRGVGVASVGVLASLFATEAEAASLPSTLLPSVLDASGGSVVSPRVLELAAKATGSQALPASLATFALIMKTKITLISAVIVALAAVGTTSYLLTRPDTQPGAEPGTSIRGKTTSSLTRENDRTIREKSAGHPLSQISTRDELDELIESVFLIETEAERVEAIRRTLGLDISREQYIAAITALHFRMGPTVVFGQLLLIWSEDDPGAMARWTRRFPKDLGDELLSYGLISWLAQDEATALAWAEREEVDPDVLQEAKKVLEKMKAKGMAGLPALPESSAGVAAMLHGMGEKLDALGGPGSRAERTRLSHQIGTLLARWARRDPAAAAEFISSLDDRSRLLLYGELSITSHLEAWTQADPDAALAWARGIDSKEQRVRALMKVLPEWQQKHPDRSIAEVVDLSEFSDHGYDSLIEQLVRRWSASDPSSAMNYSMSIDHPELQNKLVENVMEFWARKTPQEARAWVAAQPAGDVHDIGLGQLSSAIALTDFDSASNMVREIEDPKVRASAIYDVMTRSRALEDHLEEALRLADEEMEQFETSHLHMWSRNLTPAGVPAFRSWLEKQWDEGKLVLDPLDESRQSAEKGYRFVLKGLPEPPEDD